MTASIKQVCQMKCIFLKHSHFWMMVCIAFERSTTKSAFDSYSQNAFLLYNQMLKINI